MTHKSLNAKAFSALEGLLIVLIVAIVGGTGYYVYNANKNTNDTLNSAAKDANGSPKFTPAKKKTSSSVAASSAKLSLMDGQVTLDLGSDWKTSDGGRYSVASGLCGQGVTAVPTPKCLDYKTLIPKGETFTNDDQFQIDVSVFDRTGISSKAADWLESVEGGIVDDPTISSLTVNGKDGVKWTATNPGGNKVTYVTYGIVSQKYGVRVYANAFYGDYYSYKNTANTDYRTYLSSIDKLVTSIKISD